ncbi:NUDIX hydrolase [Kitasatospora sp. NPDC092286]|uniref:NUDIX hydrolase n=1 Tax=Kitasatospora sp. NPDC092286 TaxID=3364087 RepID=UPI0038241893
MIPEYVAALRALVGPAHLLWMPGVHAVVRDGQGRVLLHRRSDTGDWAVLSGILDPGEEPADGVVREVEEETGIRVVVERLAGVTVSPEVVHTNGHRAQYLELVFVCRPRDPGQVARVADDESLEVGWFAPEALPPMRPRNLTAVRLGLADGERAWFRPAS